MRLLITPCIIASLLSGACNPNKSASIDIATDSATIAKGQMLFSQSCSACHDFMRDGIGPHLGGLTSKVSPEWIKNFIRNPQAVVESGDERGQKLFARYKTLMPSFPHYSEEELEQIVAFLHTEAAPEISGDAGEITALLNPIPETIPMSDVVAGVEFVTEFPRTGNDAFKTRITKLGFIPGTERLFMVDIRGKLYELQDDGPKVYMDMRVLKPDFIDAPGLATGFGSFAFHPEFVTNGLLYTGHTEKAGAVKADFAYADSIPVAMQWVISEWKTDAPESFPFKGKSRELFRINMVSGAHGVQEFAFDPNAAPGEETYGLLHIGIGDGSSVQLGYPSVVGSNENALGAIFRIDPLGRNSTNKQYGIPPSNPFAHHENPKVVKEIYAYGFRNPHRISWTKSGRMLVSNIGQVNVESINLIVPGGNYGWPTREGTFLFDPHKDLNKVYPLPPDEATFDFKYPVAQYDHDEGLAVCGGFEYTGSLAPELNGKYVFADMNNGRLFYIDVDEVRDGSIATIREWTITRNGRAISTAELFGNQRVDLRLGKDYNGEIYLFSKQDGKLYRLVGNE